MSTPVSLHPCQHLLLSIFFIIAILAAVCISHWGFAVHFLIVWNSLPQPVTFMQALARGGFALGMQVCKKRSRSIWAVSSEITEVTYFCGSVTHWNQGWSYSTISCPTRCQIYLYFFWVRFLGRSSPPQNSLHRNFPGGPLVNANAGDMGSKSGPGTKIPHALGQLSLCATTTET